MVQTNLFLKQIGQTILGVHPSLERFIRNQYQSYRLRAIKRYQKPNYVYFWNGRREQKKTGLFLRGGCDVPAAFNCESLIQPHLKGSCAIFKSGIGASSSQSQILLQTLQEWPAETLQPTLEKLKLKPAYFKPTLFDKNFTIETPFGPQTMPKSVVILSAGPDMIRTVYRHRQYGFYIDPGGWWLNQSMDKVLKDMSAALWFAKTFEKVGLITVTQFGEQFGRLVRLVQEKTGAYVLVFNVFGVDPRNPITNYRQAPHDPILRRREFNLALYDLSHQLNFSIVDIDRIFKQEGCPDGIDYAHWPPELFPPVAKEITRILHEQEII